MSRRYQSKPSFSQVAKWKKEGKSPLGPVWKDSQGRTYGKRDDPAFEQEYHTTEAWWVNLPTQKTPHARVDQTLEFPREGSSVTVESTVDNKTLELVLTIFEYPELIKRGQMTAAVNVEIDE